MHDVVVCCISKVGSCTLSYALTPSYPFQAHILPAADSVSGDKVKVIDIDQRLEGVDECGSAIAPSSTWWNNLKRKRMKPIEKAEGYTRTRSVSPFLSTGQTSN
jgi:hypothetical protein